MIQRILIQTKCRDVIKIDESRYFWVVQHPPNGQCSLSLHEKQLFKSRDSTRLSLVPDAYRSNKLHSRVLVQYEVLNSSTITIDPRLDPCFRSTIARNYPRLLN